MDRLAGTWRCSMLMAVGATSNHSIGWILVLPSEGCSLVWIFITFPFVETSRPSCARRMADRPPFHEATRLALRFVFAMALPLLLIGFALRRFLWPLGRLPRRVARTWASLGFRRQIWFRGWLFAVAGVRGRRRRRWRPFLFGRVHLLVGHGPGRF